MVIALRIRRSLQRQRVFRDRRNPLDCFSDGQLYEAFRFHRTDLLRLFDDLAADVEYVAPRQGSLPVLMQVLLMLNFITLCPQIVLQCVLAVQHLTPTLMVVYVFSVQDVCVVRCFITGTCTCTLFSLKL